MELKISPRELFPGRGPCLQMWGDWVTTKVWGVVNVMMADNFMKSPVYKARSQAGVFFQGGSGAPDGGWILLEFWAQPDQYDDFLAILNKKVNEVIDNARTHITVTNNQFKNDMTLREACSKISADTGCRVVLDFPNGPNATFYPEDNLVNDHVLKMINQLGLNIVPMPGEKVEDLQETH